MEFKKKFVKLATGVSILLATNVFATTIAFGQVSSAATPLATPYGTMTGEVVSDVNNTVWNVTTWCTGNAPVIYTKGECHNRVTGNLINQSSNTAYNTNYVKDRGATVGYKVTVYGTHEVRGQSSYTRYTSTSQDGY
ncbi:hypothetical protein LGL55_19565 [Clostridium tagluense]|uniref:hypothetical protein n=1 Tax=Clostridium tagluense TaxID=360422 RepID=UPI001C0BE2D1|nr:hypothetical protein [Clostridium tagluense]MBU3129925.1 hypothetical protein [Clostridium tagluense]MCB2311940.1 hypothetical protein [Clostridium tagluense]MCB2318149.1 hypothetical protein [Clostridium tagluense]MCB2323314.1 hypothetical protein [Clostridium tagluense]MCB2327933.1 hypothetical protein [Clostridium tagluense]